MQLVLDSKDLRLSRSRGSFLITPPEGKGQPRRIGAKKLTSIAVTASVLIESPAITLAIANEIPILFFNRIGKAQARLWSPYFGSIATLRRGQVRFAEGPAATDWMINVFALKTSGQINNLKHLLRRKARNRAQLEGAIAYLERGREDFRRFAGQTLDDCRNQMMGTEGKLAQRYWPAIGAALPGNGAFRKRSRRPAADPFNAALNYLYGMLYSVVEGGCFAAGLDPHLGLLHADEYRRPTLSFDLIEPFRPWIDRLLIEDFTESAIKATFFTRNQHGLFLNKAGKAHLIPRFNNFLREKRRFLQRDTNHRNHVYLLAQRLAQRIRADQSPDLDLVFPPLDPPK